MLAAQVLGQEVERTGQAAAFQLRVDRRGRKQLKFERFQRRFAVLAQPVRVRLRPLGSQAHEMPGDVEQLRVEGVAALQEGIVPLDAAQ